jgi:hypothetical protein
VSTDAVMIHQFEALAVAVARIRRLHFAYRGVPDYDTCAHCNGIGEVQWVPYPCPTIKTLEGLDLPPRSWSLPTIPEDVKAVRDRDGDVWRQLPEWGGQWGTCNESGDLLGLMPEADLIATLSPLTEVVDGD